ncbi:hypothetical protein GCM10010442_03600 [Kitasatospora kifunensis]
MAERLTGVGILLASRFTERPEAPLRPPIRPARPGTGQALGGVNAQPEMTGKILGIALAPS